MAGRKVSGLSKEQRTDYRREDVGFVFQFYNPGALDTKSSRQVLKFLEKMNGQILTRIFPPFISVI